MATKDEKSNDLQDIISSGIEFVEESDHLRIFQCCNCKKISIFQHIGECEHQPNFCKSCFCNLDIKECSMCKQPFRETSFQPVNMENQILQLKVRCPFKKNGCKEVQTLKNIMEHEQKCTFSNKEKKQLKPHKNISSEQLSEELLKMRKIISDLQKKVAECEKNVKTKQAPDKTQASQIEALDRKLQKESTAKRDLEKKVLDQVKQRNEIFKQEMTRHFTDQLNQKLDKQMQDAEKKILNQVSASTEKKLKQEEFLRSVTGQLNQQIEKQVQESVKKMTSASSHRSAGRTTDSPIVRRAADANQVLEQLEKRVQDCEKRLTEKMTKLVDVQKKELAKNISVKTEKQLHILQERSSKTTEMVKNELVKQFRGQTSPALKRASSLRNPLRSSLPSLPAKEPKRTSSLKIGASIMKKFGRLTEGTSKSSSMKVTSSSAQTKISGDSHPDTGLLDQDLERELPETLTAKSGDVPQEVTKTFSDQSEQIRGSKLSIASELEGQLQGELQDHPEVGVHQLSADSLSISEEAGRPGQDLQSLKEELTMTVFERVTDKIAEQLEEFRVNLRTSESGPRPESSTKVIEETAERIAQKHLQDIQTAMANVEAKQSEMQRHFEEGFRQQLANCEAVLKDTLSGRFRQELRSLKQELSGRIAEQVKSETAKFHHQGAAAANGHPNEEEASDMPFDVISWRKVLEETVERVTEKQLQMFEIRISTFELKQDELQNRLEDGFRQQFASCETIWKETLSGRLNQELQNLMKELVGKIFEQSKVEIVSYLKELPTMAQPPNGGDAPSVTSLGPESSRKIMEETVERITQKQLQMFEARISSFELKQDELQSHLEDGLRQQFQNCESAWKETISGRLTEELQNLMKELVGKIFEQVKHEIVKYLQELPAVGAAIPNGYDSDVHAMSEPAAAGLEPGALEEIVCKMAERQFKAFEGRIASVIDAKNEIVKTQVSGIASERIGEEIAKFSQEWKERRLSVDRSPNSARKRLEDGLEGPKDGTVLNRVLEKTEQQFWQFQELICAQMDHKLKKQREEMLKYFDDNLNQLLDSAVGESVVVKTPSPVPSEGPKPAQEVTHAQNEQLDAWMRQSEKRCSDTKAEVLSEVSRNAEAQKRELVKSFAEFVQRTLAESKKSGESPEKISEDVVKQIEGFQQRMSEQLAEKLAQQRKELMSYLDDHLNVLLDSEVTDSVKRSPSARDASHTPPRSLEEGDLDQRIQSSRVQITMELTEKAELIRDQLLKHFEDRIGQVTSGLRVEELQKGILDRVTEHHESQEAFVRNAIEELRQQNSQQMLELREKFLLQLAEEAASQKNDLYTHINTKLNQNLHVAANGSAELPRTLEDLQRLEDGYVERIARLKEELSETMGQQLREANDAVFQYLKSPETEITNIISKHLIEQILELQDNISSQMNEKLEQQRLEMLNNLQHLSSAPEAIEESSELRVSSDPAVVSNPLPPTIETKIDEVVRDIADQVNHQLEVHIERARVKIRGEIDQELEKLWKQAEEQDQSFVVSQAEIKKMSMQLQEEIQRSSRLRSASSSDDVADPTSTPCAWRITNFRQQLQDLKSDKSKKVESALLAVRGTPLKVRAELRLSSHGHWISLLIGFIQPKRPDCESDAPYLFSHRRTFTLMDQSDTELKRNRIFVREPGFRDEHAEKWMKKRSGLVYFVPFDILEGDSIYVKDDAILIKILLEPTSALYRPISAGANNDGVLLWKIDNYRLQKQAEVDGLIECQYSEYFYTGPKGYRLQIRAYLNGDEHSRSQYFSIFLFFRRGPWDEFLPCTFPHQTTFTILDQSGSADRRDFAKTMVQSSAEDRIISGNGFRDFALQSEIESPVYLRNDTLLVKVTVCPLPDEPPEDGGSLTSLGLFQLQT